MSTVVKAKKRPIDERALSVMLEINKLIYDNKEFTLTDVVKRNGGASSWVTAINKRNIITKSPISSKYKWTNNALSHDVPQLKLYAQWMIQDSNEYNRQAYYKAKSKKASKKNISANQVTKSKLLTRTPISADGSISTPSQKMTPNQIDIEQVTNDGWTPITKETLLGLKSINSFSPIMFIHNEIQVFEVNEIIFDTAFNTNDLIIKLKNNSVGLIASLVVDDKKLYKFMRIIDGQNKKETFKFETL